MQSQTSRQISQHKLDSQPVQCLDLALAIAVSIQVVGIILVVAMLVTPAATAQLLTDRFGRMLLVAVGLSVVEAVVGLYLSFYGNWASGATIVLVETAVFGLALALSPRRGVLVGRPAG